MYTIFYERYIHVYNYIIFQTSQYHHISKFKQYEYLPLSEYLAKS